MRLHEYYLEKLKSKKIRSKLILSELDAGGCYQVPDWVQHVWLSMPEPSTKEDIRNQLPKLLSRILKNDDTFAFYLMKMEFEQDGS